MDGWMGGGSWRWRWRFEMGWGIKYFFGYLDPGHVKGVGKLRSWSIDRDFEDTSKRHKLRELNLIELLHSPESYPYNRKR